MAYRIANKVRETTSTTGTGDLTPTGAVLKHKAFTSIAGLVSGDSFHYTAEAANGQWETGFGIWLTGPNRVWRNTVIDGSSGAGVTVNFTQAPEVFVTVPAEDLVTRALASSRFRSGSNQVIASGFNVKVELDGQEFETNVVGEPVYVTGGGANWKWTAGVAGHFTVDARMEAATTFAGDSWLTVFVNGAEVRRGPIGTDAKSLSISTGILVPAGNEFDLRLFTTTGGSILAGAARSWAQVYWRRR